MKSVVSSLMLPMIFYLTARTLRKLWSCWNCKSLDVYKNSYVLIRIIPIHLYYFVLTQKRNRLFLCHSCNWSWFVCSNKGKARTCTITVFAICSLKNNWTEEWLSLAWWYTHDDYAFPLHPRYEQICLDVPGCLVYRLYCRWVDLILFFYGGHFSQ